MFSSVLTETKKEYAVLLRLSSVVVISLTVFYMLSDKISDFTHLLSDYSELPELIEIMLKGVLILIVSDICSDICAESGSVSVAKAVQFASRVIIFIISYPLVETIITMAVSFAGG